ncbi:MAG: hypothetical protein JSS81_09160 [Acidobacteria bacterium]|nr:hypothetical protein [Acidobacteriota bacterium]
MLDKLNYEDYATQTNTKFLLTDFNLELELRDVVRKTGGPNQDMFSLVFRGPKENYLGQGIFQLRHEKLGDGELFLVPIGVDQEGYQYEAGFNRII